MDITYLKSFYTAATYNSISKAAKALHLTQPGLSIQLQALENQLDKKLFERSNKGVSLTPEGHVVFHYAKCILNLEEKMYHDLEELASQKQQLLIGACSSIADYALPCSAYTFKQIHDTIDIHIESTTSIDVLHKLRTQQLHLGIVHDCCACEDMVKIPLLTTPILLVTNGQSALTQIHSNELYALPFITREENSFINQSITQSLASYAIDFNQLNILFQSNADEGIKRALRQQDAYAFLPEIVVRHELQNKTLKSIYMKDLTLSCDYVLLYPKNYLPKKHEQCFIDFITSQRRCFCY